MAGRCYARNGVWGWSLEDQRKALAAAGADMTREFCDELAATKAKMPARVRPEWLTQRAELLKKTSRTRGETIHVATLLALGVNEGDLIAALTAAIARRDTVRAADSGFTFVPGASGIAFGAAVADWTRAKRDAQTKPGRRAGNRAAADAARARTLAKLTAEIKRLWRDRRPDRKTAPEVAEVAGLSVKTLYTELGRRPEKQKGKARAR